MNESDRQTYINISCRLFNTGIDEMYYIAIEAWLYNTKINTKCSFIKLLFAKEYLKYSKFNYINLGCKICIFWVRTRRFFFTLDTIDITRLIYFMFPRQLTVYEISIASKVNKNKCNRKKYGCLTTIIVTLS